MESFPKKGMYFEQVRRRLRNLDAVKGNRELQESLFEQVRLHDGSKAESELRKEAYSDFKNCRDTNSHAGNKLGYSPKYDLNWERVFKKGSESSHQNSEGSGS